MMSGSKIVEMIYYHAGNDNQTQRIHLWIEGVGKLQLTLVVLGVLVAAYAETAKQQETWEWSRAHILESRNVCKHPLSWFVAMERNTFCFHLLHRLCLLQTLGKTLHKNFIPR
jgi:hypothetical protein